jgi:hypothetical protein
MNKISSVTGKKGLKLKVDPSVLEKENGDPVNGNISVNMVELTNSEELFKANAATVSNGQLLLSGGSYYIGMECNGQKLRLKDGKTLEVNFPMLKKDGMELFYGQKNEAGDMNWVRGTALVAGKQEDISFGNNYDYSYRSYPVFPERQSLKSRYSLYDSVTSKVFFGDKMITLKEMVDILQKRGVDKVIDTVYYTYDDHSMGMYLHGGYRIVYSRDTAYLGNFRGQYFRVISRKESKAEKDSMEKEYALHRCDISKANAELKEWNRKNDEEEKEREGNRLEKQVQRYYAPSTITSLGWLNCDRFYNNPQKSDVPLDIPITLNNSSIEYFIIFRSFSGLLNGKIPAGPSQNYSLPNMPVGEPVTLVAFTKTNGHIYQCKEEFTVEKGKGIRAGFKEISAEELKKMFGRNVQI